MKAGITKQKPMLNKIFKVISLILISFVVISLIVVFFFPNFQFKTYDMNRTYGVVFGVLSTSLFVLLFWRIKHIATKKSKKLFIVINMLMLLFAFGNLVTYSLKIDPDVQLKDYKILFINKENRNEKIICQYDVNWKTNEKVFLNNYIEDFWIFRLFKKYNIDTLNLEEKWKNKSLSLTNKNQ